MNATKLALATVTAISLVGAVGFANAQTTNSGNATNPVPAPVMQQPMSPSNSTDSTMNNRTNTGNMNSPANSNMGNTTGTRMPNDATNTNTTNSERTARADRN